MTARRDTIRIHNQGETCPIPNPLEHASENSNRIAHYGLLSQALEPGLESFVADAHDHPDEFMERSWSATLYHFHMSLTHRCLAAFHMSPYAEALTVSQPQRHATNDIYHEEIETSIRGGVTTYVRMSQYLYNVLKDQHGSEKAGMPGNASVLDKLAKLHLEALLAYQESYLCPDTKAEFYRQLQENDDGFSFKQHFPGHSMLYPENLPNIIRKRLLASDTPYLRGIMLKDIPLSSEKIGCLITFTPEMVEEIWMSYVTLRQHFETRETFIGNALKKLKSLVIPRG